jgi:hypothetical protein
VTVPGELDRVPIKVVPIYLDPVVEEVEDATPEASDPVPSAPERRPRTPSTARVRMIGPLALLGGLVTAVLTGVGVGVAASGSYDAGAILAWAAIAVSAVSVLAALAAVVFDWGRAWGIVGLVLAVASNPWVLTSLLGLFSAP